jgi:hypothetical protein
MQLTPQDIQNALIFLNRVELKGNESMAHAPEPDTKGKK